MPDEPLDFKLILIGPELTGHRRGPTSAMQPTTKPPEPDTRLRRLPAQPGDVPAGYVWVGPEEGYMPYVGVRPQPGDLIAIVGNGARGYVTSPMAGEAMRWPTFVQGCRCTCPGTAGIVVYSTTCRSVVNLIALDATTGNVLQFFGMNELGGIGGNFNGRFQVIAAALDPTAPYDLYVMDDRRFWNQRQLDSHLSPHRGYFTLVRFALSGGQYVAAEYVDLLDPGSVGFTENDPPALETNFLSVVAGVPLVTLENAPARYLSISGGVATTHALAQGGGDVALGLRGPIVTVPQRPGRSSRRYVVGTNGTDFTLIEFSNEDVVTRTLTLSDLSFPYHPIGFCNRLLILNGSVSENA